MHNVLARLSKATLNRILQDSEPLECDADTEAESEAESEGDADRKSVASLPNMRPWRPINEPAWPSRLGAPTQEFTEDSARDGGIAIKDGSPTSADATLHAAQLQAPK